MLLRCIIGTLLLATSIGAQDPKPPQLSADEKKRVVDSRNLYEEAGQLYQRGQLAEALAKARLVLETRRAVYTSARFPNGHPELTVCLGLMGFLLEAIGSPEEALPYFEQALAMNRKLFPTSKFPDGHPDLALSINNMGFVHQSLGSNERALPFIEQALQMYQKLHPPSKYPNGSADISLSLNNMAFALQAVGSADKALPYLEQALAMNRKLYPSSMYPDGHPDVADSLSSLGGLLQALGLPQRALPHFEEALKMYRSLYPAHKYPDGHPEIAGNLSNLGGLYRDTGVYEKALSCFEQSLAMRRRLFPASKYPDGHPALATGLTNLARVLFELGSPARSLAYFKESLPMREKLVRRVLATASEAEALAFVGAQSPSRDLFLSYASHLPNTAELAYAAVWASKSAIARVLAQRHAAARVAGTENAVKLDQLKGLRRHIEQLLQEQGLPQAARDKQLTKATDARDTLERELATKLPMLQHAKELEALGPDALAPLLSESEALVDFVRYIRFEQDRTKAGRAGETHRLCYAAFVISRSENKLRIVRIELGEAKPIDDAIRTWREAIDHGRDTRGGLAEVPLETSRKSLGVAGELTRMIWSPLAKHLQQGIKTLFLAPDGDLARMPWAALPVSNDRVLLEEYSIAQAPHGPFLLEQLKYPPKYTGAESLLVLGGVDYGTKKWPALPGTMSEMNAIAALATAEHDRLTQSDATSDKVSKLLPKVRYAHFATHGFFDAETLIAEKKRDEIAIKNRKLGDETRRVAAKNPLGFTGLILANGEVMTGLSLVDLPLENLKLVTLSACETGLGEYTGGEGVQGLQRAFHLAGCPNVVASLWKVNDAATAALMAKFYHEMWVNKKPPIEALREAQLFIYRNPNLIPDLAGDRGAPKAKEALASKGANPQAGGASANPQAAKRADTKLWAAFVLSGVGK